MGKKFTTVELVTIFAIALVLVTQLLIPTVIGLADNGDFERIMRWGGVLYATEDPNLRYFHYFTRLYNLGAMHLGSYVSSTILSVQLAVLLNKVLFSTTQFDIRFLGFVHIATLLVGVWLLISGMRKNRLRVQWVAAIMLFVTLADKGFFAYFNSFYSEAESLLTLLLLVGFVLHLRGEQQGKVWPLVGTGLMMIFFILAKVQNSVLGFLLFLFLIRAIGLHRERRWRKVGIWFSAVLLVFTIAASSFNPFDRINVYQTVFYGVLKDSPTPQADLRELGIREEYAVLANTNYFTPDKKVDITSKQFDQDYYKHISRGKVIKFYMMHPSRYLGKLQATANSAFNMGYYLGNYEKSANRGADAQSGAWEQWTAFLKKIIPHQLWFVVLFFLVYTAAIVWEWRRADSRQRKLLPEFLFTVELMAFAQFLLPVLGDGEADLGKHLFLFNLLFTAMFVSGVLWVARKIVLWKGDREQVGQANKSLS